MGLNWKCPFSPFTYSITYKVGFCYFKKLCIRDTVANKSYQNFRDKRLVRPGSKYPIWQRSQPLSCMAKFSRRENIYLADFKYNITYQDIRGKLRPDLFLYHNAWNGEKVTLQLTWMSFLQSCEVCFKHERLPITYGNFCHKSLVRPKSKSPDWQDLNP